MNVISIIEDIIYDMPWYGWPLCFIYAVTIIYFVIAFLMGLFHSDKHDEMQEKALDKKKSRKKMVHSLHHSHEFETI